VSVVHGGVVTKVDASREDEFLSWVKTQDGTLAHHPFWADKDRGLERREAVRTRLEGHLFRGSEGRFLRLFAHLHTVTEPNKNGAVGSRQRSARRAINVVEGTG